MIELPIERLAALKTTLAEKPMNEALPKTVGGFRVGDGFWRLFSETYPGPDGILRWNSMELWRQAWPELSTGLFFFGEDIFGNQLTLLPNRENAFLWNHENGDLVDLLLDPITLLETVTQSGLDRIDFYVTEMLVVGKVRLLDVPETCHLHWTQPLILGGAVTTANTSIIESVLHLKTHAELWAQLQSLPPGTEIVIKNR